MLSKTKFFLLSPLLLLLLNIGIAQQYNFKTYGTKNGLIGATINSICQDKHGYLWLGVQQGGISRFDGKVFKNFTKSDGLIANDVTYVIEDIQSNIWIASTEGVSLYNGVNFKNFTTKEGLAANKTNSIYVDKANSIYFATDGGVSVFDGKTFTNITIKEGLASNIIYSITKDGNENFWFTSDKGIIKYNKKNTPSCFIIDEMKNKTFFSSFTDSNGKIWFGGAAGKGVVCYDGKGFKTFDLPNEVAGDFFGCITQDKRNNIWFGTDHGVLKYNPETKKFTLFNENNALSSNSVQTFCCDYEGNLWIGTLNGGVNLFTNESFANYTDKHGLVNNNISSVFKDNSGDLFVGTQGTGLNIFDSNSFKQITLSKELLGTSVLTMAQNKKGEIWIGTEKDGIFILKKSGNSFSIVKHITKFDNNTFPSAIMKILFDKNDNTWIATYGTGLFCINEKGELKSYNESNGINSKQILTLFEDSKGAIWVATYDTGILKYQYNKFTTLTEKDGLAGKTVWSIAEDNKHKMYFGTADGGISLYYESKFQTLSVKDGLCSNFIESLVWDNIDNCLWAGTNKGINRIDFTDDDEKQFIRYYGEQEGFKGTEVTNNGILIDNDGLLWFATINGLSCYNRKFDYQNTTSPKLRLTGIRLSYQTVDWKNYTDSVDERTNIPTKLILAYNNNHLTFDFQAMTTDNVKYSYLLEDEDNDWSPQSSNTEANYANITPGKTYTFKVKATSSNGKTSNTESFTFTIKAPWWQTWWFYTLSLIVVIGVVYIYINYRTAQLAKEKKILEDKVTERTIDLKEANNKLSVAFKDIKDSISYARIIQDAILPLDEEIKLELPQSFVVYQPRDVVSGDFYWFTKKEGRLFIAAVDCTGHGVPGAFMSMIGNSLLNEIVNENVKNTAATILKKLHSGIRKSLKQDRDSFQSKDGMDIALAIIDLQNNNLEYAGAKRPLYRFRKSEKQYLFEEIKADKQSIGGLQIEDAFQFTNNELKIEIGDSFYLFTDGYVDQFGGENGKKFSSKRLKEILAEVQPLPMQEQYAKLNSTINHWKANTEQVDDILLIGVRI